jgi:hypothetical protein
MTEAPDGILDAFALMKVNSEICAAVLAVVFPKISVSFCLGGSRGG